MCNLGDGLWKSGHEEGFEKGEAKGIMKERLASIRNLMNNMNLSAEQAMNALSVPEEDRQKYARLLRE